MSHVSQPSEPDADSHADLHAISIPSQTRLDQTLRVEGFCLLRADQARPLILEKGSLADWDRFTQSWDHLDIDGYMADHGRYRRRRHGRFAIRGGVVEAAPHAPHFQSVDYNALNGGIERWYTPLDESVARGESLHTILRWCRTSFDAQCGGLSDWDVEVHQFRIEASANGVGQPTPEGMHRDGVDFVLVLLIERRNVESGVTSIARNGESIGSFTLSQPFDAVMLDDHRVAHGVTAIVPLDSSHTAFRDVLVVTFRIKKEAT